MEPVDVTKNVLEFPADRSARLQTLTRADGGFIGGLAYSSIRGYGAVHPTVGELRCGYVELEVPYLFDETESICIGEILLTEVEGFIPEDDDKKLKLAVGYGAVLGRNENKAISMAVLDASLETEGPAPAQDEEFVLLHGDSLEMNGFISHLKLPHYVTFQSKLDSVRKTRKEPEHES
jgi:alpha-D-ribose 1-methylphosphonate 5-triphosphate synthase subunit PhnI